MDQKELTDPPDKGGGAEVAVGTCACARFCCVRASVPSAAWRRSVKRKLDKRSAEARFLSCAAPSEDEVVRVEMENEVAALREAIISQQLSVQKIQAELEKERSAAASATTEAMSMILRLQREKAEAQMEARQFKRLSEGKMAQNQQEIAALEDLLFKRDQAVQALSCEVQAYRHRLISIGIGIGIGIDGYAPSLEPQTPCTATASCSAPQFDLLPPNYPPLRCSDDDACDLDKYPSGETPREHLHKLEQRIFQLEQMPSSSFFNAMDKGVSAGQSPRPHHQTRRLEFNEGEEFPTTTDRASDCVENYDVSDKEYPVDAVHVAREDYVSTPREVQDRRDVVGGVEEADIRKLYLRLRALDADRDSMRRTLMSMVTDKAQMTLLKEIAQQMCKEVAPEKHMLKEVTPEKRIFRKQLPTKRFSIMSMIKGVISFFWRKRSSRVRYTFGLSPSNVGLLLLLDKASRMRHRRFLTRTRLIASTTGCDSSISPEA